MAVDAVDFQGGIVAVVGFIAASRIDYCFCDMIHFPQVRFQLNVQRTTRVESHVI